ncbi:MAG: gluconolactonase [Polyangiaceae bacterium]|nr:gluconolactonase [Polyangiaceae bacterium]
MRCTVAVMHKTMAFGLCLLLATAACGDDTGTGASAGSPSSGGGGSTSNGGAPSTGGSPATGGGGSASEGGGGSGTGGSPSSCDALPPGPIEPIVATDELNGSEDIAFDGNGGIVGKDGGNIVRVDAAGTKTTIAPLAGQTYGLRYDAAGALIAAQPGSGELRKVEGADTVLFVDGLSGPNGVYGDSEGNVWVTEFGGNRVIRVQPNGDYDAIVDGSPANTPNGIVLDDTRSLLFFTNYSQGRVYSVDPEGATEPVEVGSVGGAVLDGLVLDACGNLYAVDQGNSRVYRFNLDASGALVGEPELMAELPQNVANGQFGSGDGWNKTSLYVAGNPGVVYELPLGVEGAPVPGAQ